MFSYLRSEYMFKRYLHRNDWTRIIERDYSMACIHENDFYGFTRAY